MSLRRVGGRVRGTLPKQAGRATAWTGTVWTVWMVHNIHEALGAALDFLVRVWCLECSGFVYLLIVSLNPARKICPTAENDTIKLLS